MKTTAQSIFDNFKNRTDASIEANRLAIDTDQDWDNEVTIYKFKDGSRLKEDGKAQEVSVI